MKEVKPTNLLTAKNRNLKTRAKVYTLYLGNSNFIEFKNVATAKEFEINIIKTINEFVRSSNIIYSELFVIYRRIWPLLENSRSAQINILFNDLNQLFEKVYNVKDSQCFVFVWNIYELLTKLISILDKYLKIKKMYVEVYSLITTNGALESSVLKIKIFKSQLR
jgi:hypothetical protein